MCTWTHLCIHTVCTILITLAQTLYCKLSEVENRVIKLIRSVKEKSKGIWYIFSNQHILLNVLLKLLALGNLKWSQIKLVFNTLQFLMHKVFNLYVTCIYLSNVFSFLTPASFRFKSYINLVILWI